MPDAKGSKIFKWRSAGFFSEKKRKREKERKKKIDAYFNMYRSWGSERKRKRDGWRKKKRTFTAGVCVCIGREKRVERGETGARVGM